VNLLQVPLDLTFSNTMQFTQLGPNLSKFGATVYNSGFPVLL